MHELNGDGAHDDFGGRGAHDGIGGGSGGHGEGGAHPLAAGQNQVAGNLSKEWVLGNDRGLKCVLDPRKIPLQNGKLEEGRGTGHVATIGL